MCFTLPGGKIHRDSVKICIKFVLRFRAQCSSRGNRKRVLWGSSAQNQSRFNPIFFFTPTPPKDHSPFHFLDEKKWFLQKDPTAHYFEMDFSFEKYNTLEDSWAEPSCTYSTSYLKEILMLSHNATFTKCRNVASLKTLCYLAKKDYNQKKKKKKIHWIPGKIFLHRTPVRGLRTTQTNGWQKREWRWHGQAHWTQYT